MRIALLEIEGFRSFSNKVSLDFDADIVLIGGPNGTGKTSILDAILWGLCGRISRFGKKEDRVLSLYSRYGFARVLLKLVNAESGELTITRRYDGREMTLSVQENGKLLPQKQGEIRLLERLWPSSLLSDKPFETLGNALSHCVYLQQDLVRQFVEGRTDAERFQALSELVGAGRLTDLQLNWKMSEKIGRTQQISESRT